MNKPLILVVEDDAPIRNLITTTLKTQDYKYIAAATASEALQQATIHAPDVMLLDLGLPDLDGIEVIRRIRSWSAMPIIVISARSEDSDKIEALDGADDYLTKPFSVEELLARLRVTFRRISMLQNAAGCSVFTNGDLQIDFAAGCATLKGQELHLTPIEYRLLCVMAKNCGKVLTHTAAFRHLIAEPILISPTKSGAVPGTMTWPRCVFLWLRCAKSWNPSRIRRSISRRISALDTGC